jgi:AhpD family alkylhydroperoxidase
MSIDAREILNDFMNGAGKMTKMDSAFMNTFFSLSNAAGGEVLSSKTKELIGVAIGIYNRCKYCICVHTHDAYRAGATRQEILAAAEVAIAFGGGPSVAYSAAVLNAALDEFEHDFD